MLEKVTIIIPTYNRPNTLARAIEYYTTWNCQIIVCDSSAELTFAEQYDHIMMVHLPGAPFTDKIVRTLKLVKTPYVCLCPDDDFLSRTGIQKGIEFLEANKDYISVQGRYIQFQNGKNGLAYSELYKRLYDVNINSNKASERVIAAASWGMHQIYSLYRTGILENVFPVCGDINESAYAERNSNIIPMFYGKHVMLPIFWMARDAAVYGIYNFKRNEESKYQYNKRIRNFLLTTAEGTQYMHDFAQLFSSVTGASAEEGIELFKKTYYEIYFPELPEPVNQETLPKTRTIRSIAKLFVPKKLVDWTASYRNLKTEQFPEEPVFPFSYDPAYLSDWELMAKMIKQHGILSTTC